MIVELILSDGIGHSRPVRLSVSQILVRQDNGTPIMVAAEYGANRSQCCAKVGDKDFLSVLQALGINETVICDRIEMPPPPPGARLIAGPKT